MSQQNHVVIIVGAGPTGMTVARGLLDKRISVIMIEENPEGVGGGARDSIFWNKDKLKLGIMRKFPDTLANPRFRYYGGIRVGEGCDVTLAQLNALAPVVLTCGSRGDRLTQVTGSRIEGVHDANEIIRTLNSRWLAGRTGGLDRQDRFPFPALGTNIAMIGMGNVIADSIMHVDTLSGQDGAKRHVSVLVRRGPFANKIAAAEMKWMLHTIDKTTLEAEIKHVMLYIIENEPEAELASDWQDNSDSYQGNLLKVLKALHIKEAMWNEMPGEAAGLVNVRFHFYSQVSDVCEDAERVTGIKMNRKACGGQTEEMKLDIDTLIYSVGSSIDENLGLPLQNGWLDPDEKSPYRVKGSETLFMAGWARQPSVGLAGVNVKDGKMADPAIAEAAQPIEDNAQSEKMLTGIQQEVEAMFTGKTWTDAVTAKDRLDKELAENAVLSFVQ